MTDQSRGVSPGGRTLTSAELFDALDRSRPRVGEPTLRLTAQEDLAVHFPGAGLGHTITVPLNEDGLRLLREVLRARRHANHKRSIGTMASPTQDIVDAWLKENGAKMRLPKDLEELADLEIEI